MADIFKILGKTGHIYTDYEKTNKPDGFSFNQQYEVIGSHTFTEGQQVVLGVDYEKGYKGWNFIEQKWEDVTQEDYEHLLDPARCIIAKPLPVNQYTEPTPLPVQQGAEEIVEDTFKGLSDFIKDPDILQWYKSLIVTCMEEYAQQGK